MLANLFNLTGLQFRQSKSCQSSENHQEESLKEGYKITDRVGLTLKDALLALMQRVATVLPQDSI
jgi:hypothetical protein